MSVSNGLFTHGLNGNCTGSGLHDFYRLQTKFAKVMFLHFTRVCLSTGGSTWTGTPPGQVHTPPPAGTPWAGTPPGQVHPPPQCMLGYGQQVGGAHPTGMHSCMCKFSHCNLSCTCKRAHTLELDRSSPGIA